MSDKKLDPWSTGSTHLDLAREVFNLSKSQRNVLDWLANRLDADAVVTSVTAYRGGTIYVAVNDTEIWGHLILFTVSRRGKVEGEVLRAGPGSKDVPFTTSDWRIIVNIYSGQSNRDHCRSLETTA